MYWEASERGEKDRSRKKLFWRNNVWNIPNLIKYLSTRPISSTNSKQNKHLEIHTQTHYSQTVEMKEKERKPWIQQDKNDPKWLRSDFQSETMEAIFKVLKVNNCQRRFLYTTKLSFKNEGKIKIFSR